MKLKTEFINGYAVLVDESADFSIPAYGVGVHNTIQWVTNKDSHRNKVIAAQKELNLDVPILPNYKEWESKIKAKELLLEKGIKDTLFLNNEWVKGGLSDLMIEYSNSKAKYTEEDLYNFSLEYAEYRLKCKESNVINPSLSKEYLANPFKVKNRISLQKLPKYIEIEQMLQVRHGVDWYDLPNQKEGREIDGIYRKIPKLTTNSEGKQQVIIKEVIYE